MSPADQRINRELAERLFQHVMGGKKGLTLDIGAKLPVFAAALATQGCQAWAVEHEPIKHDLYEVTEIRADFEASEWIESWPQKFDFISLIHTFEHLNDPVAALVKLRTMVADDGAVFIRMPDHMVSGYERDLTPDHFAIHPYYHCLPSVLQCLYKLKDAFVVTDSWTLDGSGQRDLVLRPTSKTPTVALGMIVKNEEVDLPRCLNSARKAVDCLCLIDTGSTDKTMEVAAAANIPGTWKRYVGASRKDETGDWKLENFAKARNVYLGEALRSGSDWVLNLDADDELLTPDAIRRATYWTQVDHFSMWIKDGPRWITHRLWKTNLGIRYDGRCHEYPTLGNTKGAQLDDCVIEHHGEPGVNQEDSNARNLRMLTLEWKERQSTRCAFYLANTHRDGQRWEEAVHWYLLRIGMGNDHRDEWLFSHLYGGRCARALKQTDRATALLTAGMKVAPDWKEFALELARIAYEENRHADAIALAEQCFDAPVPPTTLWRESSAYTDQPARLISWCHEHLGQLAQALAWSEIAQEKIGAPDKDWADRHYRLRQSIVGTSPMRKPRIALLRPGAIGDIIMTLNLVPMLKTKYPDHAIDYFCAPDYLKADALGSLIIAAGCEAVYHSEALRNQAGNYREVFNLVGYPLQEGYPEKPMRQHLLRYFADELRLPLGEDMLPVLSLPTPPAPLRMSGRYATLQRHAGWSKYKEWPEERWETVLRELNKAGIPVIEIDAKFGLPLATSIALIANAAMHIGVDSFGNHLTHYLWDSRRVPGVILWGSTQWDAAGYPENVNLSKGLSCQPCFRETHPNSLHPRGPCIAVKENGVHACMDAIQPEEVVDACLRTWRRIRGDNSEAEVGRNRIAGDDADRVNAGDGRHA